LSETISGFPPIAGPDARILILGSMPSEESLRRQQYYAHPRNGFWPIMMTLLGQDPELPYAERTAAMVAHGIALWDVLGSCERTGSLDASIVSNSEVANDFTGFFRKHPRIQRVYFNGRKAEQAFRARVLPTLSNDLSRLQFHCLPSTSPAMASLGFRQKLEQWRQILE
jgi:TDG/mug DNA glycosylase family protein